MSSSLFFSPPRIYFVANNEQHHRRSSQIRRTSSLHNPNQNRPQTQESITNQPTNQPCFLISDWQLHWEGICFFFFILSFLVISFYMLEEGGLIYFAWFDMDWLVVFWMNQGNWTDSVAWLWKKKKKERNNGMKQRSYNYTRQDLVHGWNEVDSSLDRNRNHWGTISFRFSWGFFFFFSAVFYARSNTWKWSISIAIYKHKRSMKTIMINNNGGQQLYLSIYLYVCNNDMLIYE